MFVPNMKKEDSADHKKTEIDVILTDAEDPLSRPIKMNKCGRPRTSGLSIISQPKSIISQTLYAERMKNNVVKYNRDGVKVENPHSISSLETKIKLEPSMENNVPLVHNGSNHWADNTVSVNVNSVYTSTDVQTDIKTEKIVDSSKYDDDKIADQDTGSYTGSDDNILPADSVSVKSERRSRKHFKRKKCKNKNKINYTQEIQNKVKQPLNCTYEGCAYASRFLSTLKMHIVKKHIGEKTISCDLCSYKCYHKGELHKHLITHSKESPYACDYPGCNYSCKISSNLKKHKRIHTGERPYICEQCTFRSNFISSLKAHRRVHTNERPFYCECCGYRSNNASNLKKHFLQKHPDTPYILLKLSSD